HRWPPRWGAGGPPAGEDVAPTWRLRNRHLAGMLGVIFEKSFLVDQIVRGGLNLPGHAGHQCAFTRGGTIPGAIEELILRHVDAGEQFDIGHSVPAGDQEAKRGTLM